MRILVVGYAGEGNAGDDILLSRFVEGVTGVQVVGAWGANSVWDPPDIQTIARGLPDVIRAIEGVDAVIIGPGGIIHNERGYGNRYRDPGLAYYDALTAAAASKAKPIGAVGIGIGPLVGSTARRVTQRILERCSTISVRDEASRSLANELGIFGVEIVRDLAFAFGGPFWAASDGTTLGVCIRPWKSRGTTQQISERIAAAIDMVVTPGGITRVVGVPVSVSDNPSHDDRWPTALTLDAIESGTAAELLTIGTIEDYPQIVSGLSVMVSMRLHGLILAHNAGTPAVGIAYDPKVRAATTGMGIEAVGLSDNPRTIAAEIQNTIERGHVMPEVVEAISLARQLDLLEPPPTPPSPPNALQRRIDTLRLAAGI